MKYLRLIAKRNKLVIPVNMSPTVTVNIVVSGHFMNYLEVKKEFQSRYTLDQFTWVGL